MAENKAVNASGSSSEAQPTTAEYKKSQARVRDLVEKRRAMERRLVSFCAVQQCAPGCHRRR